MGALVNQSHAKKLFGARLVDKDYAKSYSDLGNIFSTTKTKMGALVTSNFAKKVFGARWLTFRENGHVPRKNFFNWKNFPKSIFSF